MNKFREHIELQEETSTTNVAIPSGKFMDKPYFTVPHEMYTKGLTGKSKGKHWKSHLGKSDDGKAIQQYARKNPKQQFFLKSAHTGDLVYARVN